MKGLLVGLLAGLLLQIGLPVSVSDALGEVFPEKGFDTSKAFELSDMGQFVHKQGRIGGL